jgi:hypothetical protein
VTGVAAFAVTSAVKSSAAEQGVGIGEVDHGGVGVPDR